MDTIEYATFRCDTVEVENGLKRMIKSSPNMNRHNTKRLRHAYLHNKYFVNDLCSRWFNFVLGIEILATEHIVNSFHLSIVSIVDRFLVIAFFQRWESIKNLIPFGT